LPFTNSWFLSLQNLDQGRLFSPLSYRARRLKRPRGPAFGFPPSVEYGLTFFFDRMLADHICLACFFSPFFFLGGLWVMFPFVLFLRSKNWTGSPLPLQFSNWYEKRSPPFIIPGRRDRLARAQTEPLNPSTFQLRTRHFPPFFPRTLWKSGPQSPVFSLIRKNSFFPSFFFFAS